MSETLSTGPSWRVVFDAKIDRVRAELDARDCAITVREGRCILELPGWLFTRIVVDGHAHLPSPSLEVSASVRLLEPTPLAIQRAVASFYVVGLDVILGDSRRSSHSRIRHVAMYLGRKCTTLSFPELGEAFGRDHSTIQHAVRKIEREMMDDPDLTRHIGTLRDRLSAARALAEAS